MEHLILFLGGDPVCMVGGVLSCEDEEMFLNEGFEPISEDLLYDSSAGD